MKKAKNSIAGGRSATILFKPTTGMPYADRKGTN
jgi:hypothetical protein